MSLMEYTAVELGKKIKAGEITAVEAATAAMDAIEASDSKYNCYVTVLDRANVLKRAEEVQKAIEAGELIGPLAGVPVAIKDNMCTKGVLTTCSSKILYNFEPTYTSEAVINLEKAGAVIIGKTNMDEFAMGSTTETSYYGPTLNPWNPDHVPGGSSGGSAAAVVANECTYALGSDTGGSIRQPASYCGVVGMKPTYGTVSRYGLIAYGSSLDQIGPIAKDVTDCATILETIASYDEKDSTSVKREAYDFTSALVDDVKGMKIGIPRDYLGEGLDPAVKEGIIAAAKLLEEKGAIVEQFDLSLVEYAIPAYYVIASAEASSNLARFEGVKYGYRTENYEGLHQMFKKSRSEGFGPEVKRRIMLGSFVLSSGYYDAYYLKALRTKALIKQAFDKAFEKYDVILGPAAPTTAPKIGESLSDPIKMYLGDIYTISVNLAGLPGICLPCGMDSKGLPIGLQLIGDCFKENNIIRAAYAYEQSRGDFTKLVYQGNVENETWGRTPCSISGSDDEATVKTQPQSSYCTSAADGQTVAKCETQQSSGCTSAVDGQAVAKKETLSPSPCFTSGSLAQAIAGAYGSMEAQYQAAIARVEAAASRMEAAALRSEAAAARAEETAAKLEALYHTFARKEEA